MLGALIFFPSFHLFFPPPVLAQPLSLLKEWLLLRWREHEREAECEVHVWELGKRNSSSVNRKTKTSETAILWESCYERTRSIEVTGVAM